MHVCIYMLIYIYIYIYIVLNDRDLPVGVQEALERPGADAAAIRRLGI